MERIYFDNGSTSWPKAPKVAESMAELLTNGAFNINRGNYEGAYEVAGIVLETREQLKRVFCKHFLEKNAKYFWRMLHLQIGESCKASAGSYSASYIAIADHI